MSISEAQITSLGIWTTSPCNYLVSESGLLHLPGTNILVEIGKCFQKELGFFRSNFRETYRFSSYFTFIVSAWPRRFYDLRRFNAEFVQLEASERIFLVKKSNGGHFLCSLFCLEVEWVFITFIYSFGYETKMLTLAWKQQEPI